jgi:hypothetical protein
VRISIGDVILELKEQHTTWVAWDGARVVAMGDTPQSAIKNCAVVWRMEADSRLRRAERAEKEAEGLSGV